jgi:hypothetical protein
VRPRASVGPSFGPACLIGSTPTDVGRPAEDSERGGPAGST